MLTPFNMAILETGQTTDLSGQTYEGTDGVDFKHISSEDVDSPEDGLTRWTPEFAKWNGFRKQVPELNSVIHKFGSWTFGRGIKADAKNKKKLDKIKGNGKQSARIVLKIMWEDALTCGDSFGHITKSRNVKSLNPGKVTIVYNQEGIIVGYEMAGHKGDSMFQPEEILHFTFGRIADEVHGTPMPEAIVKILESRGEALEDLRILYHRTVKPIQFYEAMTNDTDKLNSLEAVINKAYKKSESIVISSGTLKEIKRSSSPQFSNPDTNGLTYIKFLVRHFITSVGMPEIIMGYGADTTEASANIIYLAFQQEIEDMQLYNQEMVEMQLGITMNLEFPASIETMLQRDNAKDGPVKAESPQAGKDT